MILSTGSEGGMATASAAYDSVDRDLAGALFSREWGNPKEANKPCRTAPEAVLSAAAEHMDGGAGQREEPDEAVPTPPKDQGGPGFDRCVGASKPEGPAAPVTVQDDAAARSASVHGQDAAMSGLLPAALKAALDHPSAGDAAAAPSPALSGVQLISHRQALERVMAAEEVAACKAALRAPCAELEAAMAAAAPAPCITAGAAGPPAGEAATLSSNSKPAATTSPAAAPFWPPPLAHAPSGEPLDLTGLLSAPASGAPPPSWLAGASLPAPASVAALPASAPPPIGTEPSFSSSWLGGGPLWTTTRPAALAPGAPWPDSVTPPLGDASLLSLATASTAGRPGTWSFTPAAPAAPTATVPEPSVERLTAAAARVDATQKQLQAVHGVLVGQIVGLELQLQQEVWALQEHVEAARVSKAVSARQVELLTQEVADLRASNMCMRLLLQQREGAAGV